MKTIAEQIEERMQLAAAFEDQIECDPGAVAAHKARSLDQESEIVARLTDDMDRALARADRRILRRIAKEPPKSAADVRALFELYAWLMHEAAMGMDDVLDTAADVEGAIRAVLAEWADCGLGGGLIA